mgnify:CR=1 FL=1
MKYYVQFLNMDLNCEATEALGSDGVFILDGRHNLMNMAIKAKDIMERRSKIHNYIGFRIINNDRFINSDEEKSKVIYEFIK